MGQLRRHLRPLFESMAQEFAAPATGSVSANLCSSESGPESETESERQSLCLGQGAWAFALIFDFNFCSNQFSWVQFGGSTGRPLILSAEIDLHFGFSQELPVMASLGAPNSHSFGVSIFFFFLKKIFSQLDNGQWIEWAFGPCLIGHQSINQSHSTLGTLVSNEK